MGCNFSKAKKEEKKTADAGVAVKHILRSKVTRVFDVDRERIASPREQDIFTRVIEEPDFYNIPGNEEILIWSLRYSLTKEPAMLVKFLLST
jgi:hypothetical protein